MYAKRLIYKRITSLALTVCLFLASSVITRQNLRIVCAKVGVPKILEKLSPRPLRTGVADPLETLSSPTCVMPNFVALGQTVWA